MVYRHRHSATVVFATLSVERFINFNAVIYFMAEKVIRDPLYGFISLEKNELALKLIDTPEFQRLKHIRMNVFSCQ